MHGILPLWKPRGMTSHDCVAKMRKLLGTKKVGHAGTLDPEVPGVLIVCVGQATKLVPYLTDMPKTYDVTCALGIATETEDAHGDIIAEATIDTPPSLDDIKHVLKHFTGDIKQTPPMYSAVRVKGKRLYEYARENIPVERPTRQVTIYDMSNLVQNEKQPHQFHMTVTCSKGTFMRTLCVDIGRRLGYPAHMASLIRTKASSFTAEEAVDFTQVETAVQCDKAESLLYPLSRGLAHLDQWVVDDQLKRNILHGQKLPRPKKRLTTDPFVIAHEDRTLAIYQIHPEDNEQIKPVRVFLSDEM